MKQMIALSLFLVLLTAAGCEKTDTDSKVETTAPMVIAAPPSTKMVPYYEKFEGRLESTEKVDLRARVSGYLIKIHFQPGTEVKKGDRLFDIDPKPLEADVSQVQSQIARAQATLDRLTQDFSRTEKLRKTGAASQEDYDKALGNKLEAEAMLKADKARLTGAELNLGYTRIDAPISGLIGDHLITEGNLIQGGSSGGGSLLTTIVAVEKMDMSFDVDENKLQRIQKAVADGKVIKAKDGKIPVEMGITIHGNEYPIPGEIIFMNNTVDPKTGTLRVKAEFNNPKTPKGPRLLTAGMYARVQVRLGEPVQSMLVPDRALGSDLGTKFVYVLGKDNKAEKLTATLGELIGDERVIESVQGPNDKTPRSLRTDEQVIVNGMQRVRPGMVVDPKPPYPAKEPGKTS